MKSTFQSLQSETRAHSFQKSSESFFISQENHSKPFFGPASIQPKLKIGDPNDRYEKQADRVADAVVHSTDASQLVQRQEAEEEELQMMREPNLQLKCQECREEENLQQKSDATTPSAVQVSQSLSSDLKATSGKGLGLPKTVQSEMSYKMGVDFSSVNIHTGPKAVEMSQSIGARAFTFGKDIYFNSGEYNPSNTEGKHLLAHELTHVIQQGSGHAIQRQEDAGVPLPAGVPDVEVPAEPEGGWPDRGMRILGPQANDLIVILSQCTGLTLERDSDNMVQVYHGVIDTDISTTEASREVSTIIENPYGIIINADNSDRQVGIGAFSHDFPGMQTINVSHAQRLANASGASGGMDLCSPIIHEISEAYSARMHSIANPDRDSTEIYNDAHSYGSTIEDSIRSRMGLEPRAHGGGVNIYLFNTNEGDRVYLSTTVFGQGENARTLLELFSCELHMESETSGYCENTHLGEHVIEGEIEIPENQREVLELFNRYASNLGFSPIEIPESVE